MATKINYYIDNTLGNPPQNWRETSIELNFDKDIQQLQGAEVSLTSFDFVNDINEKILKYIEDGKTTGVGVFEGMPLKIEINRANVSEVPFEGYLDVSTGVFSRTSSTLKATETNRIDWLNEVADGFTFDYLRSIGKIPDLKYIKVPYVLSNAPDYMQTAVSLLSVYVMASELRTAIVTISKMVARLAAFFVYTTLIELILYIAYVVLLIAAMIKLLKTLITTLIQPVKYHAGMTFKDMLTIGAEHLGLVFKSEVFETFPYSNLVYIPSKYYNPLNAKNDNLILGISDPKIIQEGHYKGTFGQLIRDVKTLINGKVVIKGNEMRLLRRDKSTSQPQYTLPPLDINSAFSLNSEDFKANYYLTFQLDPSDRNTYQDFQGTNYQVILQPQRVTDQRMVLMKGLEEVRLPFARASRKNNLTTPERILDNLLKGIGKVIGALIKAINAVIKLINLVIKQINKIIGAFKTLGIRIKFNLPSIPQVKTPDFNIISKRIGMMKIESDIINVPKICVMDFSSNPKQNKINPSNNDLVSARYLWEQFYNINSFLPSAEKPNGNQYIIRNYENVPFIFQDYLKVKENNVIFASNGDEAEILSLKWNIFNQVADIKVRFNKIYTTNLRAEYNEPTGE
jgi:hypothetical protein